MDATGRRWFKIYVVDVGHPVLGVVESDDVVSLLECYLYLFLSHRLPASAVCSDGLCARSVHVDSDLSVFA